MQNNQQITVTYQGAEHTIEKIGPGALVKFERQYNVPVGTVFGEGGELYLEYLLYLAYLCLAKELGDIDFDTFIEGVEDIDMGATEETDGDPTEPAPQPAS